MFGIVFSVGNVVVNKRDTVFLWNFYFFREKGSK